MNNICSSKGCDTELPPESTSLVCSQCEINKSQTTKIAIFISIVGLMLILFIIYIAYSKEPFFSSFGDFVGGVVSPLVALAGVILLYDTLTLQRKELKEAREQFKKSSAALERQSELEQFKVECRDLYLSFKPHYENFLYIIDHLPNFLTHPDDKRFVGQLSVSGREFFFTYVTKEENLGNDAIQFYLKEHNAWLDELRARLKQLIGLSEQYIYIIKPAFLSHKYLVHPEINLKMVEIFPIADFFYKINYLNNLEFTYFKLVPVEHLEFTKTKKNNSNPE